MCEVCQILNKEKEAKILYEDEKSIVFFPSYPIIEGHITVASKEHFTTIESVPADLISHFFYVASFSATTLFEGLGMQGTNIIMNDGSTSNHEHFTIDVIPRKEEDGIDFKWDPKKFSEEEVMEFQKKIQWEFIPPEERQESQQPSATESSSQQISQQAGQSQHLKQVSQEDLNQKELDEEEKKKEWQIKFFQKIP